MKQIERCENIFTFIITITINMENKITNFLMQKKLIKVMNICILKMLKRMMFKLRTTNMKRKKWVIL